MSQWLDRASSVRRGEEPDAARLSAWLTEYVPGASGTLTVKQFPRGFSNLTYLLQMGGTEMVLRRSPFGNRVRSAHDMGREYRVLSKLSTVYDLAPKPLAYCDDESVIGAPFYVMEKRTGIILRSTLPPGMELPAESVRRLCESFIDNLARLHAVDYKQAGLEDLGNPDGFIGRQVAGWSKRYAQAATQEISEMDVAGRWLADHMPTESGASLIHNDYKYDNLLLDPIDTTRIIGVLDWEMCTIGDPLLDLGVTLSYWVEQDDIAELKFFVPGPTNIPGSYTRQELIDRYARATGRDVSNVLYFYIFGLYKLAVIIQQIYYRFAKGHTQDDRFSHLDRVVVNLARAADAVLQRQRI